MRKFVQQHKIIRVVLCLEEDEACCIETSGYATQAEIREGPHGLEIELEMSQEEVRNLAQTVILQELRETARLRAALAESQKYVQYLRSFLPPPIPLDED